MTQLQCLEAIAWRQVPQDACALAKEAAPAYAAASELLGCLPDIGATAWYSPESQTASFGYPVGADSDGVAAWHVTLKQVPGVERVKHGFFAQPPKGPHVMLKSALPNKSVFGPVASLIQLKPNRFNELFGGPNPLMSTIAGGLLGAGVGYGGGWLAEQFLPEEYFEDGKLRRTGAIMGGIAGTLPGLAWGVNNAYNHPDEGKRGLRGLVSPHPVKAGSYAGALESLDRELPQEALRLNEWWEKYASETGEDFIPAIPVDQFNRVVWNDIGAAGGFTPPPLAAATTGITQAASMAAGTNFISPMDVARIGVGMGSGYVSGLLVGRALGAMAGLKPSAQDALQRSGVWAGTLANIVPIIFR